MVVFVVVVVAIVVVAVVQLTVMLPRGNPNTNSLDSYVLHCGAINSLKRVLLCVKVMS